MSSRRRSRSSLAALPWAVACALAVWAAPAGAGGLRTAVDVTPPPGADGPVVAAHTRAAGARMIRMDVTWRDVAPAQRPAGFDPANPDSPGYAWSEVDREVRAAVAGGLEPVLYFIRAPDWAEASPSPDGVQSPDPAQAGAFATALARRYDGTRPGLPRVRYFSIWNEANWSYFFSPQVQGGRDVSVDRYREMVNLSAAGIHGVHADDVVIAGELFPNALVRGSLTAIAPLRFARELLCVSAGARPHRTCSAHLDADAISVHPYTSGGPSLLPAGADNVWLSTLPRLTSLVRSAQRLGTLRARSAAQTWVTEFSWVTDPPRKGGVPMRFAVRWVSEALYRAWGAGVSVFAWFSLRDDQLNVSRTQSGLWYGCSTGPSCDSPKPTLQSFRFPFVAYHQRRRRVTVWGRLPPEAAGGRVTVQALAGRTWRRVGTLAQSAGGIFAGGLVLPAGLAPRSATLRALAPDGVTASNPFSLKRPRDFPIAPFV